MRGKRRIRQLRHPKKEKPLPICGAEKMAAPSSKKEEAFPKLFSKKGKGGRRKQWTAPIQTGDGRPCSGSRRMLDERGGEKNLHMCRGERKGRGKRKTIVAKRGEEIREALSQLRSEKALGRRGGGDNLYTVGRLLREGKEKEGERFRGKRLPL